MTQINPTLIERAAIAYLKDNEEECPWDYLDKAIQQDMKNCMTNALTAAIGEPVCDLKELDAEIKYYEELNPNHPLLKAARAYAALFADGADK